MPGFMQRLQKLASSPQGRRVIDEAKRLAKDPARRKQLDDLRRRLSGTGGAKRR